MGRGQKREKLPFPFGERGTAKRWVRVAPSIAILVNETTWILAVGTHKSLP